jgi:hypothetical protein
VAYSLKEIKCSDKACIYSLIVDNYNFLDEVKGHYPKDHSKLLRYCERFSEKGQIYDITKFRQITDRNNLYEFKTDNLRFLCLQLPGKRPRTLIINHYHKKQKKKSPSKDLDKAIRISNELIALYNSDNIEFGE